MDLPRPSLVTQLKLYLSPEGRGFAYLLADQVSGGILRLSRPAAMAYAKFSRAALGDASARAAMSEDEAKLGYMSLTMSSQMRRAAEVGPKAFNPLSIHLEFLDVGPLQARLGFAARWVFSRLGLAVFAALILAAIVLGIRNDWSAATAFKNSMSLQAILTFGLMAPFLKLIHETGHVLACTRYGVRVRMGGVNIIGFYPMPFVDCSEADLIAQRYQRIMISAAGVLTDCTIGLVTFLLWHVTEGSQTQDLMGYIFVFSTLNSLLFNMNPLMRMDGYFAVSDALGRRNLGADATQVQKAALAFVQSLGKTGALPAARSDWALLVYSCVTAVYRVTVLVGILWLSLPLFLGAGVVAAAWSAWAMYGSKLTAPRPAANPLAFAAGGGRIRAAKWAGVCAAIAIFLLIPVSPRVMIELKPDAEKLYNMTNPRAGFVTQIAPHDAIIAKGQVIAKLQNADIADAVTQAALAVEEAAIVNAISQGAGAAEITAGAKRVANADALQKLAIAEAGALTITATQAGRFTMARLLPVGAYLPQGTVIGQIFPLDGPIVLTGAFPETHVIFFDAGLKNVDLWTGTHYRLLDISAASLVEQVQQDRQTQSRGFTLHIETEAADLGPYPQVRLAFKPIPIWQHIAYWGRRKLAQFRDAQLAETERRIEN